MTAPETPMPATSATPLASVRVRELLSRMTLEEKLAQLVGYWVDQTDDAAGDAAPMQNEMSGEEPMSLEVVTRHGIGHLSRVYGTHPVDPVERARWLHAQQRHLRERSRLGIPALVHEECLTGLAAWQAATFPTPLAWGATFDPELVQEMGTLIGASMHELGVHQGLAPVLDVVQDARWGRVEECIAEDPYVVGTIGTSYVRGLQAAGVHATLKHLVGYSASRAGRNLAPVHAGPREVADILLPPFEMAVVDGGARSVMNSYSEIDGVPAAVDSTLLTGILRDLWAFTGTVVADYFSVAFLTRLHGIAADHGDAAAQALTAGIDVELPTGDAYLEPLAERVRTGLVDEKLVDRAVQRVLSQKEDLGLLDATFDDDPPSTIDLDSAEHRDVARRIAEESIVLISNNGVLPLRKPGSSGPGRIAVIGPNAERSEALLGCYSFVNHVLAHRPDVPLGIDLPTVADGMRREAADRLENARIVVAQGCAVEGDDRSGFDEAAATARDADVAVVVVGDQSGLFGRGTVGEGNDVASLELPGVQRGLVETIQATGTPVVLVVLTGRPYAMGWALSGPSTVDAVIQTFFPGEEGGIAIAGVLSGRVNPSGRLPVSLPRTSGTQPYSYLHPTLGGPTDVTSADPTPAGAFGHGLSYTAFTHDEVSVDSEVTAGHPFLASVRATNVGSRTGDDVVQLYARDVLASVTRPSAQLLGYCRIRLEPGESATVRFEVPTTRLAFTDRHLTRIVEPGDVEVWVGMSAADRPTPSTIRITGDSTMVGPEDERWVRVNVSRHHD